MPLGKDYNVVMRYLISVIVFAHFQRPCVATNMKIREFVNAKRASDGSVVVLISEHKTDASGPAQVALKEKHYEQFQQYLRRYDILLFRTEYDTHCVSNKSAYNKIRKVISLCCNVVWARPVSPDFVPRHMTHETR